MPPRPACEIPAGHLVDAAIGGAMAVCLKAERAGKGHVNHYLVPLEPLDGGLRAMRLVYVDPDSPVEHRAGALIVGPVVDGAAEAQVGDVLVTAAGEAFLKLLDDEQSQRLWAYVDLASGQVRRRRERHAAAGLRAWRLEITAPAGS